MAVRSIVLYPDPVLLKPTHEVTEVNEEIRQLIDDLYETMVAAQGIGLAANQIGETHRVCVVDLSAGEEPDALHVFVNPRILESDAPEVAEEGCLSFPDVLVDVKRGYRTVVEALDREGEVFTLEADGLLARAIQHECEHLNGKTFIDGLSSLKRDLIKRRIKKRIKAGDWVAATETL